MSQNDKCIDCGAKLEKGQQCYDYFEKMLSWDFADFTGVGQVHHLTVLCYYLQHPHYYSKEGLNEAIKILKELIEHHLDIGQLYQRESSIFDSNNRDWRVSGTDENHGQYSLKINWSMNAQDVVRGGVKRYPAAVYKWAELINSNINHPG